jgi:hypothetical protein
VNDSDTQVTLSDVLAAVQELTAVIRGLTAVLIDDRDTAPQEPEAAQAAVDRYMDGSPRGG